MGWVLPVPCLPSKNAKHVVGHFVSLRLVSVHPSALQSTYIDARTYGDPRTEYDYLERQSRSTDGARHRPKKSRVRGGRERCFDEEGTQPG